MIACVARPLNFFCEIPSQVHITSQNFRSKRLSLPLQKKVVTERASCQLARSLAKYNYNSSIFLMTEIHFQLSSNIKFHYHVYTSISMKFIIAHGQRHKKQKCLYNWLQLKAAKVVVPSCIVKSLVQYYIIFFF